jgi:hypothetical protein
MPSPKKAKELAQGTICRSILRQWGLIWKMDSDENAGKFWYWKYPGTSNDDIFDHYPHRRP